MTKVTQLELFDREFTRPPYAEYEEDLVAEYLWIDSKVSKLHRHINSNGFEDLPVNEQIWKREQLQAMLELRRILGSRAEGAGLWGEIQNILQ